MNANSRKETHLELQVLVLDGGARRDVPAGGGVHNSETTIQCLTEHDSLRLVARWGEGLLQIGRRARLRETYGD